MKVSLVGYGQMGKMIESCVQEKGWEVVSRIDPHAPGADHAQVTPAALGQAQVAICFTSPDVALENIQQVLACKLPLVMGTTGWTEHLPQVKTWVEQAGVGMLYSSNFSLGVNLFFRIVQEAAKVMNHFDLYDVAWFEAHHRLKRDSPSGTGLTIANILLHNIQRKTALVTDKLDRKPSPEELHFASLRLGSVPGTHSVLFDSEFDSIELTHSARTRKGFALGSLIAAEWLVGQKGLFTEADLMNHLLGS